MAKANSVRILYVQVGGPASADYRQVLVKKNSLSMDTGYAGDGGTFLTLPLPAWLEREPETLVGYLNDNLDVAITLSSHD